MTTLESLQSWLEENRLDHTIIDERIFTITDKGKFYIVLPKEGFSDHEVLFNSQFSLMLSDEEQDAVQADEDIAYFAFQLGSRWYYCDDPDNVTLMELRYLGKEKEAFNDAPPFLGVHGAYDLTNGSRSYDDWVKKAKFSNYKVLGIAEENTLAGTLQFQSICSKKEIHPIIGETITIEDSGGERYSVKLYVNNEIGWRNLLLINSQINVFNIATRHCAESYLLTHAEGLNCVLTPEVDLSKKFRFYSAASWHGLYYQFDVSRWDSDERDKKMLLNTQYYLKNYLSKLKPVLITDAYYLEQTDSKIRKDLHAIGRVGFKNQSKDQFFKTPNQIFEQIATLFKTADDRFIDIAELAMNGAREIAETDFKIDTGKLHLPEYEMKPEEKEKYGNQESMFWGLIEEGLERKIIGQGKEIDAYVERIEIETGVILGAKLYNYFLIIWDFLNYSHEQGWLTGYGRGSAAGSVVAYLMDIVQTDPLEYGLLFERFLNEGRLYKKKKVQGWRVTDVAGKTSEWVHEPTEAELELSGHEVAVDKIEEAEIEIKVTGSMPDIDNDVPGEHRDEIKKYLESRYGHHRVASIGTYGTFKIKAAIQSLARRSGTDTSFARYASGAIPEDTDFAGLFKIAQLTSVFKDGFEEKPGFVKDFVQQNPDLIEKIPLVFGCQNNSSIHAGGVIIVPISEHGLYDQLPVKMVDGILVSEWEMDDVEAAGFLKMDILGLKQLDKFAHILQLIKDTTGDEFSLLDIPLDDEQVYDLFGRGLNEDVFQFKGYGLKSYTSNLKPENVNDLIATVALYRPGPIETGAHNQYVNRKNGKEQTIYLRGTEEILKETYGLMCYQEQVMEIVSHLAGFTKNQADEVRKAIGKKIPELMKEQKDKFIDGAVKNGYDPNEMKWLWDQIEVFATYSFNKSHAACYAITGYHCQWLKAKYPLQFWTVSLKYADEKSLSNALSEIYTAFPGISIAPVDINKSELTYTCDVSTSLIYWTISSVKMVGEQAVKAILEERQKNGMFFSIQEFATRMKPFSRAVKKNTIQNLIIAGAFDEIERVKNPMDRFALLENYMNFISTKMDDEMLAMKKWKEYRWIIEQKRLSGLGVIDFRKLVGSSNLSGKINKYLLNKELLETEVAELPEEVLVAGMIVKFDVKGKKENPFAIVEISDGQTSLNGAIWSETYLKYKELFENPMGKLLIMSAAVRYDDRYKKCNTFYSTRKSLLNIIED